MRTAEAPGSPIYLGSGGPGGRTEFWLSGPHVFSCSADDDSPRHVCALARFNRHIRSRGRYTRPAADRGAFRRSHP